VTEAATERDLGVSDGVLRQWVGLPSPSGLDRAGAGGHPCQGIFYVPADRPRPSVAFIATHQNVDFSEHYMAELLARRGFGFLGWNTRFRGDEAHFLTDHAVADIGAGVRWLRAQGVETVVLLGNSGGGSLMAAYQSQAVSVDLEPGSGLRLSRGLEDLPAGDLYVSLAAHPGRARLFATTMDPSIIDERDPVSVDPSLDMYHPDHGPSFDEEFVTRYRQAQVARNRRITKWAFDRLDELRSADQPATDQLFTTYRLWANLAFLDGSIEPNQRLLGVCWVGDARKANYGVFGIGQVSTLRTWINMWSLDHSLTRGELHLPKITQPSLVIGADADTGIFPSDADALYQMLGSADKQKVMVEGDHYFVRPTGARDGLADLVAAWVTERC
jgi:hypothetical protein